MLRLGLEIADRIVAALPSRVAYALADLAGDAWYRLAPERRRLVAANLARVCAATGRPTGGRAVPRAGALGVPQPRPLLRGAPARAALPGRAHGRDR